jgi:hypothetical protein
MAQKKLLFFIHGIGRHAENWVDGEDGPVPALERAMALYPDCFPAGARLRDFVDVVEIRYDDIFDDQIKRWSDQVKDLPVGGPGTNWVGKLQELWSKANGEQKKFTDSGGDVILYRGFDLIARSVRLRINKILVGFLPLHPILSTFCFRLAVLSKRRLLFQFSSPGFPVSTPSRREPPHSPGC